MLPPLAITAGEPAGIGPDLVLQLSRLCPKQRCVLIADRALLQQRMQLLGQGVALCDYGNPCSGKLEVCHIPTHVPVVAGQLNPDNARYVLDTLDRAMVGCLRGEFAALVTAPVHKGVINDAGISFTGHTEYLAEQTGIPRVVMLMVGGNMRLALATTHLPLRDVAKAITVESLTATLRILDRDLQQRFKLSQPHILVAGLNPHAGEGGYLGREEIDIIEPVLQALRAEGMKLSGPLPADTLFQPHRLRTADAVLVMYHDQGLPVLKHISFGAGVNITLGLPLIRTSVDHGTALDLAGHGKANADSLQAAVQLADWLVSCHDESWLR